MSPVLILKFALPWLSHLKKTIPFFGKINREISTSCFSKINPGPEPLSVYSIRLMCLKESCLRFVSQVFSVC